MELEKIIRVKEIFIELNKNSLNFKRDIDIAKKDLTLLKRITKQTKGLKWK